MTSGIFCGEEGVNDTSGCAVIRPTSLYRSNF